MVRLGSSTRQAIPEMIQELQHQRYAQGFDALPCPQTSYKDLDHELIRTTFATVQEKITKTQLKTLKILVPYGDDFVPSNAGVILFAKPEVRQQIFPMAYVSCARFDGIEKVDFIDQLDVENILLAVNEVPKFIRRNTQTAFEIKTIKRKEVPEYAPAAIREGLLNALMHADYSYQGTRIFVSIFNDRIEIRNPGCLPPGMTIDAVKEGVSVLRNLVIARIFKMLGWVEQFGTGYLRIQKTCKEGHYPLPEWRELGPYFDIIFKSITVPQTTPRDQVGTKSGPSRDQVNVR